MTRYPFADEITRAATAPTLERRLDPRLLAALIFVESSYKPHAYRYEPGFYKQYLADNPRWTTLGLSPERLAASYGLTQILYTTAVERGFSYLEPEYLFVPTINLAAGADYLASLLAWADNDVERALCAYNGGKGAAMKKPYRTAAYADKVLKHFHTLDDST